MQQWRQDAASSKEAELLRKPQPHHQSYFIDGPGRLTSALQLLPPTSATANPPQSSRPAAASLPSTTSSSSAIISFVDHEEQIIDNSQDDDLRFQTSSSSNFEHHALFSSASAAMPKTIVASDSDVSNGFVRDGKKLPYVFEATESGTRKKSSKILPVCGVCGKRFVCVTTMKRHLVTHTGEKPFSCKICGKQYTQKGNLRVHERTHRNDRPFECNICHQKFYRKEPMQKHQWRQHGIVHFKSRPNAPATPQGSIIGASESSVLYNSIVDQIKNHSFETYSESSRNLDGPSPPPPHSNRGYVIKEKSQDVDDDKPRNYSNRDMVATMAAAALNMTNDSNNHANPVPKLLTSSSTAADEDGEFKNAKFSSYIVSQLDKQPPSSPSFSSVNAAASLAKIVSDEDNHDDLDDDDDEQPPFQVSRHDEDLKRHQDGGDESSDSDHQPTHPLKLKKKLAHAYQREFRQEEKSKALHLEEVRNINENLDEIRLQCSEDSMDGVRIMIPDQPTKSGEKENVECQCKSCGNIFKVSDPFNFRCSFCHIKYTSLPTHMIADPLQCIGCCQVFPHKPGLKSHQTCPDKERPFRCCKCGYGFRQKAHLQKHQWRIHRRKIEPDPNVREAEAIFSSIKDANNSNQSSCSSSRSNTTTITIQDVIDKSVEHSMSNSNSPAASPPPPSATPSDNTQPLDLSPSKASFSINRNPEGVNPKLIDLVAAMPALSPRDDLRTIRESNPLLNQRPISLPSSHSTSRAIVIDLRSSDHHTVLPEDSVRHKKQRTLDMDNNNYHHHNDDDDDNFDDRDRDTDHCVTSHRRPLPPLSSLLPPQTTATVLRKDLLKADPQAQPPPSVAAFAPAKTWLTAGAKKFLGLPTPDHVLTATPTDLSAQPRLPTTRDTKDLIKHELRLEQIDRSRSQNLRTV